MDLFSKTKKTNFELGYMHEHGIAGKNYDDNKAIEYYQKVCCDTNTTIDIDKIWQIWQNPSTDNVNKNHCKEAMKYLKNIDDMGCADALCQMGNIYKRGIGYMNSKNPTPEIDKALECYKKAAKLGSATAYEILGYMYDNGEGVKQDCNKANEYYKKSNGMKMAICHYDTAIFLQYCDKDIAHAMQHYEKAGLLGFIGAYKYLAYIYQNGVGVSVDRQKADDCNKKANDLENMEI